MRLLAHLSRWMAAEDVQPAEFTGRQIGLFLDARRADHTQLLSRRGLAVLLEYLSACRAIPPRADVDSREAGCW